MRWSTFIMVSIAALIGFSLFQVKYKVVALEEELAILHRKIVANQEAIHILNAEWSYLTEPKRLQKLAEKFLTLKPVSQHQIISFDTLWSEEMISSSSLKRPSSVDSFKENILPVTKQGKYAP